MPTPKFYRRARLIRRVPRPAPIRVTMPSSRGAPCVDDIGWRSVLCEGQLVGWRSRTTGLDWSMPAREDLD